MSEHDCSDRLCEVEQRGVPRPERRTCPPPPRLTPCQQPPNCPSSVDIHGLDVDAAGTVHAGASSPTGLGRTAGVQQRGPVGPIHPLLVEQEQQQEQLRASPVRGGGSPVRGSPQDPTLPRSLPQNNVDDSPPLAPARSHSPPLAQRSRHRPSPNGPPRPEERDPGPHPRDGDPIRFDDPALAWVNDRPYLVKQCLGHGGFATVYEVELLVPWGTKVATDSDGEPVWSAEGEVLLHCVETGDVAAAGERQRTTGAAVSAALSGERAVKAVGSKTRRKSSKPIKNSGGDVVCEDSARGRQSVSGQRAEKNSAPTAEMFAPTPVQQQQQVQEKSSGKNSRWLSSDLAGASARPRQASFRIDLETKSSHRAEQASKPPQERLSKEPPQERKPPASNPPQERIVPRADHAPNNAVLDAASCAAEARPATPKSPVSPASTNFSIEKFLGTSWKIFGDVSLLTVNEDSVLQKTGVNYALKIQTARSEKQYRAFVEEVGYLRAFRNDHRVIQVKDWEFDEMRVGVLQQSGGREKRRENP